MSKLTKREREVALLLASGVKQKEIARRLIISPHTVYRHVANMRNRTGEASTFSLALRVAVEKNG